MVNWYDLRRELLDLVLTANHLGRGRIDSEDWEDEDDERLEKMLDTILKEYHAN